MDEKEYMNTTILIVDDDEKNRKLLKFILNNAGYNTVEVADGESALAEVRINLPDLILMDYRLPGIDGIAAAKLLKSEEKTAKIPIIMVTASAMGGDKERILKESGCEAYISKPINIHEILEIVKKYISPPKKE
jgi:two-component system cell cycle response regulator DivK